ncbi:MAG: hypothetical protein PVH53_12490, partial [Desulfobacterales bacterium]
IQTTDGDKVTLSSDMTFEAAAVTYQELGRTDTRYSESQAQINSAGAYRNLELTIEGHLDEQEKKEVKMVLTRLFKMIKDFMTGRGATDDKQSLANLSTISDVKAEVDMRASLTVASQTSAKYMSETPLQTKPVSQQPRVSHQPEGSDHIDKLTDRMIGVVKDSGVAPSKILDRFNRQISKLSRLFINGGAVIGHGLELRRRILQNFVSKLREWMAENEPETSTHKKAETEKAALPDQSDNLKTTVVFSHTSLNAARQDIHLAFEYSSADQHET